MGQLLMQRLGVCFAQENLTEYIVRQAGIDVLTAFYDLIHSGKGRLNLEKFNGLLDGLCITAKALDAVGARRMVIEKIICSSYAFKQESRMNQYMYSSQYMVEKLEKKKVDWIPGTGAYCK